MRHTKPLIFLRGNHELCGPFARRLLDYVPTPEGRFYYAREAGPVDLVIAGHQHRFSYTPPGPDVEHSYHLLVLDQDQVAQVDATAKELKVVVSGLDGSVVHTLVIPRR